MFKKDNVWQGIILGLILPGMAVFITEVLKKNIRILQKEDLLYIGCVALNLILVKYFYRIDRENMAKGVVASTFICAFIFFYHKMHQ
jgi:hypothetical protein